MRRASSQTSLRLVIPRSGSPKEAFATPGPGQVKRAEAGFLGEQRAEGIDRARDLQRALGLDGVTQPPARGSFRHSDMIHRVMKRIVRSLSVLFVAGFAGFAARLGMQFARLDDVAARRLAGRRRQDHLARNVDRDRPGYLGGSGDRSRQGGVRQAERGRLAPGRNGRQRVLPRQGDAQRAADPVSSRRMWRRSPRLRKPGARFSAAARLPAPARRALTGSRQRRCRPGIYARFCGASQRRRRIPQACSQPRMPASRRWWLRIRMPCVACSPKNSRMSIRRVAW